VRYSTNSHSLPSGSWKYTPAGEQSLAETGDVLDLVAEVIEAAVVWCAAFVVWRSLIQGDVRVRGADVRPAPAHRAGRLVSNPELGKGGPQEADDSVEVVDVEVSVFEPRGHAGLQSAAPDRGAA
jgi:hypothetical protein